jgi:hypothetical protein
MSVTVAFRVMAHPKRASWAEEIAAELDCPIIWDEVNHAWDTGKRALLAGAGADYVCVIQDDVILSDGLRSSVEAMVQFAAGHPIDLYAHESPMTIAAQTHCNGPWYAAAGPKYGPGVVIPTKDLDAIIRFGDGMRMVSYDTRLYQYYRQKRVWCFYTNPSLVQHRSGHGSLIRRNARDRTAPTFGSGVGLDWSFEPPVLDNATLHPRVVMRKDGRQKVVRHGTKNWQMAKRAGWDQTDAVI